MAYCLPPQGHHEHIHCNQLLSISAVSTVPRNQGKSRKRFDRLRCFRSRPVPCLGESFSPFDKIDHAAPSPGSQSRRNLQGCSFSRVSCRGVLGLPLSLAARRTPQSLSCLIPAAVSATKRESLHMSSTIHPSTLQTQIQRVCCEHVCA